MANAGGRGWSALVALAVVPLYIRLLGIEAYGLVGLYLSLTAILALLDFGLGTALNRQLAHDSLQTGKAEDMRDLLRTVEVIYGLVGLTLGTSLAALAPYIASHWVKPQVLSVSTVAQAVFLMGVAIACQWPRSLYVNGLSGIQRQVALNVLASVMATILHVGGVLIVWLISPTIQALIGWYAVIMLIDTLLTRSLLWRSVPQSASRPVFDMRLLTGLWRFAAGMTGISVTSVILTQFDKIILSKVLSLDAFGYYSLAWRVAGALYYLVTPTTTAAFPRFAQLAALNDQRELARLYHRSAQLISVLVLPLTVVLVAFPDESLLAWTGDPALASQTSDLLRLVVLGTTINGFIALPFTLQVAHGRTKLVFYMNSLAVLILGPLTYFASLRYGGIGAAWVWLVLNCSYVAFFIRSMHRRLLPRELRTWLLVDIGAPLVAALAVAGLWRLLLPAVVSRGHLVANLAAVSCAALAAAVLAAPQMRQSVGHWLANKLHQKARAG